MEKIYYAELVFTADSAQEARNIMRVLVDAYRNLTKQKEIQHGLSLGVDSGFD